jgi:hypothetical protein
VRVWFLAVVLRFGQCDVAANGSRLAVEAESDYPVDARFHGYSPCAASAGDALAALGLQLFVHEPDIGIVGKLSSVVGPIVGHDGNVHAVIGTVAGHGTLDSRVAEP